MFKVPELKYHLFWATEHFHFSVSVFNIKLVFFPLKTGYLSIFSLTLSRIICS